MNTIRLPNAIGGPEIDVHGCTRMEAIRLFIDSYNQCLAGDKCSSIKVIHGWGSSGEGGDTLRSALTSFLNEHRDYVSYDSYRGYMIVKPHLPLPTYEDYLGKKIRAYCCSPKSMSKIISEFHDWGDKYVSQAVKRLERAGQLKKQLKRRAMVYVAST